MIVEDDADQREGLSDLLADVGYRVAQAASGAGALAAIRVERPALVLVDLLLQDMDGRELLSCIRALCAEPPPVLFTTGVHPSLTEDITSEILLKPFDVGQLLAVVARYCEAPTGTIFDSPSP